MSAPTQVEEILEQFEYFSQSLKGETNYGALVTRASTLMISQLDPSDNDLTIIQRKKSEAILLSAITSRWQSCWQLPRTN